MPLRSKNSVGQVFLGCLDGINYYVFNTALEAMSDDHVIAELDFTKVLYCLHRDVM